MAHDYTGGCLAMRPRAPGAQGLSVTVVAVNGRFRATNVALNSSGDDGVDGSSPAEHRAAAACGLGDRCVAERRGFFGSQRAVGRAQSHREGERLLRGAERWAGVDVE